MRKFLTRKRHKNIYQNLHKMQKDILIMFMNLKDKN